LALLKLSKTMDRIVSKQMQILLEANRPEGVSTRGLVEALGYGDKTDVIRQLTYLLVKAGYLKRDEKKRGVFYLSDRGKRVLNEVRQKVERVY